MTNTKCISSFNTLRSMTEEKLHFLDRFIEVINDLGYPERGRQTQLAGKYKVTQGAVRRWFAGETMPSYEISIDLCKRAQVHYEWLMTGRGPKSIGAANFADARVAHIVRVLESMSDPQLDLAVKIVDTLADPLPSNTPTNR